MLKAFFGNNDPFAFLKKHRMLNDDSFNIRDLYQVRQYRRTPPLDANCVHYAVRRTPSAEDAYRPR